jgi:alkylation response protein AidB-like acyl-CoA dehydrogenase
MNEGSAITSRTLGPAAHHGGGDCVARARAVGPIIAASLKQIDADRELPSALVSALHEARLFHMLVPRSLGGEEVSPVEYVQALEEIAKADASTAWCLGQTSVCSTLAASLPEQTAREIYVKNPRGVLGWGPPGKTGRAVAQAGGYRLSGTWLFASGSRHATWLGAHCPVFEPDGEPRRDANGNPVDLTLVFPRDRATITDTWHVIGLKGTGSDTYSVTDLFVPSDHAVAAFGRNLAERRETGPLYRFTVFQLFGASFAGVALGIARATLDAFVALARTKTPTSAKSPLRDNAVIQSQIGIAEAQLASARVFLHHALGEMWNSASHSGTITIEQRVALRMASSHASHLARQVVDTAYHSAGATAIFDSNPFARRFRDMHTVSQQVQAHYSVFEAIGQYFLGMPIHPRLI